MVPDRDRISTGPNSEPLNENIGDGAWNTRRQPAPGEELLPEPPTDEQVEEAAEELGAPQGEVDTLPLDGE